MATRRRRTPLRGTRRSQSPIEALIGWVSGLWAELTDEQRRDLAGLLLAGVAAFVSAAMLVPGVSWLAGVHRLTLDLVGMGWPLLVGGLAGAGLLLLHPAGGGGVQRIQGVAAALAGVALLGLLSLVSAPAGGAVGRFLSQRLTQGLGAGGAVVILSASLALAGIFALRLRVGELALALGAARAGMTGERPKPEQARPRARRAQPAAAVPEPQPQQEEGASECGEEERLAEDPDDEPGKVDEEDAPLDHDGEDEEDQAVDEQPSNAVSGTPRVVSSRAWRLPTMSLLAAPRWGSPRQEAEVKRKVGKIEAKLGTFGIAARVVDVDHGPTVTRYVLEIPDDVPVAKVERLAKDLSLALAASPLRIEAPIPGRSAIGIEVPSKVREIVALRTVLQAEGFAPLQPALTAGLGCDVAGVAVTADLTKMPHLLTAGATGQGKSVCINCLICSLLLQHSPDTLRLILIDPKRVELVAYTGLPHLAAPVIVEPEEAVQALGWAVEEMNRRYKELAHEGVRNIAAYNERMAARRKAAMPYLLVVVDELADLMMISRAQAMAERRAGCEVEDLIVRLAQMARAVGIHLVLATQRPSVDVITGLIKANVPSRIAFTVASQVDSRTILDSAGAEKLLGRGDMLYQPVDGGQVRLQGAWLEDREVEAIAEHWKRQGAPSYLGGLTGTGQSDTEVSAARLSRQGGGAQA